MKTITTPPNQKSVERCLIYQKHYYPAKIQIVLQSVREKGTNSRDNRQIIDNGELIR